MIPVIADPRPVTDDHFDAVQRLLGVSIPPRLRAVPREVNGVTPSPQDVPCAVYSGETHAPVHEFARWDEPTEYAALCRVYHRDLSVPRRFLVFATADADTFFVDIEDPRLRVMYFQYVEGGSESHFGDGEMDRAADSIEEFMGGFFDGPAD